MAKLPLFGDCGPKGLAGLPALISEHPPQVKSSMARVMGQLLEADLTDAERRVAEDIVRTLCDDMVASVRKALAAAVASCPHLPPGIAERLALDIEEVSIPVLEFSALLTDDVLLEVVGKGSPRQLEATARRAVVSEQLSDAIVERRHLPAVSLLIGNAGAALGAETWVKIIERHGDDAPVIEAATRRGSIPEPVARALADMAKEHVFSFVVRHLGVPAAALPPLDAIRIDVREGRRVTSVVPANVEPNAFAKLLHAQGRLDRTTLVQALCAGEFTFLTAAVARLTELPFLEVQRQLFSSSEAARQTILERVGIEPAMVRVFHSLLATGYVTDREEYHRLAIKELAAASRRDEAVAKTG